MTFVFPKAVLGQHIAILGKTGAGKTSTEKLVVEQVVEDGARVCVLDTVKSDWWGITSSASGKRAGLPFKILGGPRGHVPLHANAGKVIGQLVATGKLPLSIIDMADFEAGGVQRFFVDFAQSLFRHMRGVVYLVIEEAHEVAPKERAGFSAENMAIHWAKKLATGGRSKGIRLIVATQRVQSLHNAVLGSCETLIAHRLTLDADQEPVIKWLKNSNKAMVAEVAESLSSLPTGTGWLCSGEAKIFEQVAFPKFKTFDNSKTPDGEAAEIDVTTAPVDQDELRAIIGDAVKQAEADDSRLLRARIAKLETEKAEAEKKAMTTAPPSKEVLEKIKQLALRQAAKSSAPLVAALEAAMKFIVQIEAQGFFTAGSEAIDQKAVEKAMAEAAKHATKLIEGLLQKRDTELRALHATATGLQKRLKDLILKAGEDITIDVNVEHREAFSVSPAAPAKPVARALPTPRQINGSGETKIGKGETAVMKAVAQYPAGASREQLTVLTGYKRSTRDAYLQRLGAAGWVAVESGLVRPTQAGIDALGPDYEPLPTGAALREHWLGRLPEGERKILQHLVAAYPRSVDRDEIGESTSYKRSTRDAYLQRLSTRMLVVADCGTVRASEILFDA